MLPLLGDRLFYNIWIKWLNWVAFYIGKRREEVDPVSRYLYEKGEPFERGGVIYPLYKQIPISVCLEEPHDGKLVANEEEKILRDDLESPFRQFEPSLKMTGIFIQRFFFRKKFKDIAEIYGISQSNARQTYSTALKIIHQNLEPLDSDGRKIVAEKHYKKMFRNNAKKIPKNKKWWIMCNYFGLTPSEVADMEGTTNHNVSIAICRFDQRLRAGNVLSGGRKSHVLMVI